MSRHPAAANNNSGTATAADPARTAGIVSRHNPDVPNITARRARSTDHPARVSLRVAHPADKAPRSAAM